MYDIELCNWKGSLRVKFPVHIELSVFVLFENVVFSGNGVLLKTKKEREIKGDD